MAAATVQVFFVVVLYTLVNGGDDITASEGAKQVFGVVAFQKFRLPVSVYDDRTQ